MDISFLFLIFRVPSPTYLRNISPLFFILVQNLSTKSNACIHSIIIPGSHYAFFQQENSNKNEHSPFYARDLIDRGFIAYSV